MSVTVRAPVLADADRLAQINIDAWRSAYAGIVPDSYLNTMDRVVFRDRWLTNLSGERPRPGTTFVVAEVDGQLATYGICGPYRPQEGAGDEDTSGWGELYAIYTDPPLCRRGAGKAVLGSVVSALRDAGFAVAALWVLRENRRGIDWYGARGWRPDGASSRWLAGDAALPEIRMRRRLH